MGHDLKEADIHLLSKHQVFETWKLNMRAKISTNRENTVCDLIEI